MNPDMLCSMPVIGLCELCMPSEAPVVASERQSTNICLLCLFSVCLQHSSTLAKDGQSGSGRLRGRDSLLFPLQTPFQHLFCKTALGETRAKRLPDSCPRNSSLASPTNPLKDLLKLTARQGVNHFCWEAWQNERCKATETKKEETE